jgi:hypothetical protein
LVSFLRLTLVLTLGNSYSALVFVVQNFNLVLRDNSLSDVKLLKLIKIYVSICQNLLKFVSVVLELFVRKLILKRPGGGRLTKS